MKKKWKWKPPSTDDDYDFIPGEEEGEEEGTWTAKRRNVQLEVDKFDGAWRPEIRLLGLGSHLLPKCTSRAAAQHAAEKAVPALLLGTHLALIGEMTYFDIDIPNEDDPDIREVPASDHCGENMDRANRVKRRPAASL